MKVLGIESVIESFGNYLLVPVIMHGENIIIPSELRLIISSPKFGSKANWILDVKYTEILVGGKKEGAMQ